MENKRVPTSCNFESSGSFTIEKIVDELPILKKLSEMSPNNPECDHKHIVIHHDGRYTVRETHKNFGGEGGVEPLNYSLGEQEYQRKGQELIKQG